MTIKKLNEFCLINHKIIKFNKQKVLNGFLKKDF